VLDTPTPGPTPAGGGTGQIAFASTRSGGNAQIYLSDLTGENVVPITNVAAGACEPAWSPDGSRLVFVSPCHGWQDVSENPVQNTALFIINADGSNLTPLPTVPGGDFEPAWSPDGKRIAFTSLRDGYMQIYVMNLDDQSVTRLTNTSADVITRQPSWSPFGNQIVYAAKRFGAYQIWTMTDTGQGQQQIARSGQELWDYYPVWSLDGKAIVFTERNAKGPVSPWMMDILYEDRSTGNAVTLKYGPLPIENVHYSPDGLWFIFEGRDEDENRDIFIMTSTGEQRTRLTKDPAADFDPAWRPAP
jgi:Tol biopolymer transport system component